MTHPDHPDRMSNCTHEVPAGQTSDVQSSGEMAPPFIDKRSLLCERRLEVLRSMTPQQKLEEVFKLNDQTRQLFRIGLRQRYPDLDDAAFEKLFVQMMLQCHNRSY